MSTTTTPTTPDGPRPAGWSTVRLIARREIRDRLASKAFRILTLLLVVAIVALCLIIKATSGGPDTKHVAFTPSTAPLAAPLHGIADSTGQHTSARTVSEAAGRKQVRSGKADALITGSPAHLTVVVKKELDGKLKTAVTLLARQAALNQQITDLGGDPAKVGAAVDSAKPTVTALEKKTHYDTGRLVMGSVVAVLLFMALQINGQMVAQGVVEEKTSRVVEILLATVRPWQLMAGKVLGIGSVGLGQLIVVGGIGLGTAVSTDVLSISVGSAVSVLVWLIAWFVIGFFMYALLLAAAGALVSRQEDVASVTMPVLMLMMVPYVLAISVLPSDPGNSLIAVLSVIPLFAPTLMPVRLVMGNVPAWESGLSVALSVALILLLVRVSGRVYRNAVLRTGSRVSLKTALRSL